MPDWLAPWTPLLTAVLPALITGIVAWKWGDVALKAKDATIESLKQQNETLKLYDVKEVNARYAALRDHVQDMSSKLDEFYATISTLDELVRFEGTRPLTKSELDTAHELNEEISRRLSDRQ
jgi:hypothetical protein